MFGAEQELHAGDASLSDVAAEELALLSAVMRISAVGSVLGGQRPEARADSFFSEKR